MNPKFYALFGIIFAIGTIGLFLLRARFLRAKHREGSALYLLKGINFLFFTLIFFALFRQPDQTKLYYTAFIINAGFWFILDRKKISI